MKEEDIRKRELFNRYISLVEKDAKAFFLDKSGFTATECPACGGTDTVHEFQKSSFDYVSCDNCATLFVNPRPSFEDLIRFYENSESTRYWIEEFFKPVAEVRREKIFRPRAEYIYKCFPEMESMSVGDIGAGFGIFLDELSKLRAKDRAVAIEPSSGQADICRELGLEVLECALEKVEGFNGEFDLLTAFELFEHLHNPRAFIRHVNRLLKPGGHFFLTTLNGLGFDILLLWEKSKSIMPPVHLNFFNPDSIATLLQSEGFDIIESATPGKLDWDIVEGMIKNEGADPGRLWTTLASRGNDACKAELQKWISEHGLSSHMRILARKKLQDS